MEVTRQPEAVEGNETELVRRAQQGDAAAFEALYRLYSRKVYALCLRMVGDPARAEDLTQDVFIRVFRKIETFRGDSAFTTWLHRIAVNIVLMSFRKNSLVDTPTNKLAEPDNKASAAPKEVGAHDAHLAGTLDRVALQAAINELPAGCKSFFILHDVEGYGHDEIARIVGCSSGNSKSQVHRARIRLRKLLLNARAKRRRNSAVAPNELEALALAFDWVPAR